MGEGRAGRGWEMTLTCMRLSERAGGDEVARLPAVGAQACVRPAAVFLKGEWVAGPSSSIQVDGDSLGGAGGRLMGRGGGQRQRSGWERWAGGLG